MAARDRRTGGDPVAVWCRAKVLALLVAGVMAGLLLLVGLGLALLHAIDPPGRAAESGSTAPVRATARRGDPGAAQRAHRDELAAAPMPTAPAGAAQPSVLSTRDPGFILLPRATILGPAGVPAGFAHNPPGALAQLTGIDTTALNSASLGVARAVVDHWAAAGGPSGATWSGVRALADFLSAAGLSSGKAPGSALSATPLMGLVKASDGGDWVVVCVDFEVDATLARTVRVAVADCARMAWAGDRWVIGPGAEPAPAPSIWPGTQAAIDAGYKELRGE